MNEAPGPALKNGSGKIENPPLVRGANTKESLIAGHDDDAQLQHQLVVTTAAILT
jgi:hypothetical protein